MIFNITNDLIIGWGLGIITVLFFWNIKIWINVWIENKIWDEEERKDKYSITKR